MNFLDFQLKQIENNFFQIPFQAEKVAHPQSTTFWAVTYVEYTWKGKYEIVLLHNSWKFSFISRMKLFHLTVKKALRILSWRASCIAKSFWIQNSRSKNPFRISYSISLVCNVFWKLIWHAFEFRKINLVQNSYACFLPWMDALTLERGCLTPD